MNHVTAINFHDTLVKGKDINCLLRLLITVNGKLDTKIKTFLISLISTTFYELSK